jgi:predicted PurR-regulated permease PerM
MDWAQILVIILAVFLAIFLLLGIVLIGMFIRITKQIKNVTESAQRTAESIEHTVSRFSRASSFSYLTKKMGTMAKKLKKKKQGE